MMMMMAVTIMLLNLTNTVCLTETDCRNTCTVCCCHHKITASHCGHYNSTVTLVSNMRTVRCRYDLQCLAVMLKCFISAMHFNACSTILANV